MIASRDLRFCGDGTVLAGGREPRPGELALFCRPVVTAPAVVRRDGTVAAGAWLPDLVRLGELEAHLGHPRPLVPYTQLPGTDLAGNPCREGIGVDRYVDGVILCR